METELIKVIMPSGVFTVLFFLLLRYTLIQNDRREYAHHQLMHQYNVALKKLSENYTIISEDVKCIKTKMHA